MIKKVIGVRFKKAGKIYYFDPLGCDLTREDHVVVETVQGLEYGEVAIPSHEMDDKTFPFPVKPIVRRATPQDDADYEELRLKEKKARPIFERLVWDHDLEMKLVDVSYTFDKRKAIFFFTSNGRVDFRMLLKDLAAVFRVRIELRQIGARDETKLFNTLGCCGRTTCCSQWLGSFTPVSIKMAKEQNLSLNINKISGVCGRLLCCLNYENDFYKDVSQRMPKVGQMVETPDGVGQVYRLDVLREKVMVKFINDKDEVSIKTFELVEIGSSDAPKPVKTPKPVIVSQKTENETSAQTKSSLKNGQRIQKSGYVKKQQSENKSEMSLNETSTKRKPNSKNARKSAKPKTAKQETKEVISELFENNDNQPGNIKVRQRSGKGYFRTNPKKNNKKKR